MERNTFLPPHHPRGSLDNEPRHLHLQPLSVPSHSPLTTLLRVPPFGRVPRVEVSTHLSPIPTPLTPIASPSHSHLTPFLGVPPFSLLSSVSCATRVPFLGVQIEGTDRGASADEGVRQRVQALAEELEALGMPQPLQSPLIFGGQFLEDKDPRAERPTVGSDLSAP